MGTKLDLSDIELHVVCKAIKYLAELSDKEVECANEYLDTHIPEDPDFDSESTLAYHLLQDHGAIHSVISQINRNTTMKDNS